MPKRVWEGVVLRAGPSSNACIAIGFVKILRACAGAHKYQGLYNAVEPVGFIHGRARI